MGGPEKLNRAAEEIFALARPAWESRIAILGLIVPICGVSAVLIIIGLSEPAALQGVLSALEIVALTTAVVAGVFFAFAPAAYILDAEEVVIARRLVRPAHIPYRQIRNVALRRFPGPPFAVVRLGSYPPWGFFGYFGRFKVENLGWIRVYAASWENEMVVLGGNRTFFSRRSRGGSTRRCGRGLTALRYGSAVRERPEARAAAKGCRWGEAGVMGKKAVLVTGVLAVAAGIVLATLFLPVETGTGTDELRQVRLGRPFWFVVQDQSGYTPPGDVWTTRFLSPWECPFTVVWWRFAAATAAVAGGLVLLLAAAAFLIRRVHGGRDFRRSGSGGVR